jgi:hypothetical protein
VEPRVIGRPVPGDHRKRHGAAAASTGSNGDADREPLDYTYWDGGTYTIPVIGTDTTGRTSTTTPTTAEPIFNSFEGNPCDAWDAEGSSPGVIVPRVAHSHSCGGRPDEELAYVAVRVDAAEPEALSHPS